jgi:hypothetical protein
VIDAYYVYGVLPAGVRTGDRVTSASLGGSVRTLEAGPLAALVEQIEDERDLGTREDLVAHSAVLNEVAEATTVVPLRFGTVLPGSTAVTDELLNLRRDELVAMLDALQDTTQFVLRARYELDDLLREVVATNPEVGELRERTSGLPEDAAYYDRVRLGELVAGEVASRRDAEAQVLLDALIPLAVEHVVKEPSGMDHLLDCSFRVRLDQRADFEMAAERQAERLAGRAQLRLIGPTAVYDFVPEG